MKKILSAVAALGLVAGVATVATAADFTVTGNYKVEGYYINNVIDADGATDLNNALGRTGTNVLSAGGANAFEETGSDSFYMHTFQMLPTMKVNDNITMKSDIRLRKEAMWGTGDDSGATTNTTVSGVDVNKIYMEYASPVGKITVGRTPAGAWGSSFLNSATAANRIMWAPSMVSAPWSALVYTQKTTEADSQGLATNDQDTDQYHVGVGYTTNDAKLAVGYFHNVNGATSTTDYQIDVDGMLKFAGNYFVSGEYAHIGGEKSATGDWDADGLLLAVGGDFGALSVHGAYVYASGWDGTGNDDEALMNKTKSLGKDFQPLYIFTGDAMGILNHDEKSGLNGTAAVAASLAGVHCYALIADYKVSDRLTLHGAIAYGKADETAAYGAAVDDSFGMEYNVGAAYKLLDNLTYEAHFGYVDAGDFFQMGDATADIQDITLLSHSLTMKF